ncbi:uncharacterized protein [Anabrus simplex]|uniref:uncharacterized protein n=1 Tax=Anabrus simplex TaxID=316456 RepID=UPI0035A2BE69
MKGVSVAVITFLACVATMRAAAPGFSALPRTERAYTIRAGQLQHRPDDVDDTIAKALERLRESMSKGIPELQLPVLDPLNIHHFDLNISSELATIRGRLDDVVINNLSSYKLERIANDLDNLKIEFTLSFKPISLSGHYNVTGKAGFIDIFGNGPFSLRLNGLVVDCSLYLTSINGVSDGAASLASLDIHISISAIKAKFENLMGGGAMGDLVNELIGEVGPDFIKANPQEVSILIGKELQQLVNPILGQYTLRQILHQLKTSN